MTEQQVTLTLDVPDGYEVVEHRVPRKGDVILDRPGIPLEVAMGSWSTSQLILRKLPSPTVAVPNLPRKWVEWRARKNNGTNSQLEREADAACDAALKAEAQP